VFAVWGTRVLQDVPDVHVPARLSTGSKDRLPHPIKPQASTTAAEYAPFEHSICRRVLRLSGYPSDSKTRHIRQVSVPADLDVLLLTSLTLVHCYTAAAPMNAGYTCPMHPDAISAWSD
jgi:hypothetical protein